MFKKPNSSGRKSNLSQFGLIDIPDLDDGNDEPMDFSDDDIDLEAELAAFSGEGGNRQRPRKPAPVPSSNLDAMIAASLKDVPSDEEVSGDEDDPDLLSELKELAIDDNEAPAPPPRASRPAPAPPSGGLSAENSTVSLLQERISNYTAAEKSAKENGEGMRARRFTRGLKTLNDLLKQAKAGKPIVDEDIPPPVVIKKTEPAPQPPSQPSPSAPEAPPEVPPRVAVPEDPSSMPEPTEPPPLPPATDEGLDPARQQGLQIILKRKEEFKAAALSCKHAGNKALALEYLKVVKQFDLVVDAYKAGQEMDLGELPTPEMVAAAFKSQEKTEDQTQGATDPQPSSPSSESGGLITASTVDEALRQRLAAFQEQEKEAKEKGEASKARRMGRIVKQYQDAIKLHASGKPIPVDELPAPKGFAPLPTDDSAPAAAPPAPPAARAAPAPRPAARPAQSSRYEKQLSLLLHRQKEFKEAALRAKKNGNIEQAKEYLRAAKGFDSVIDAARGGLAVDLKSLPLPPQDKNQLENTFDVVSAEDCTPSDDTPAPISLEDENVMARLHQQLTSQLKLCLANRDHYKAMGNVAETNRFEHLAVNVKQDLDVVAVAKRLGQNPPKFHYETRQFSVVQCNTDLNENDLELTIVRGIAYNVPNPKEVDTYVKFEFPYPQDAPVSDRTALVKDTNSPVYDAVFPLVINRSARPCLRVFKRQGIKFEVYSRGATDASGSCACADALWCCSGWFSRDSLLGSLTVKLQPLETHVTIHEAFPLMDGRRPAGGTLELKLRVRTPLLQQHFENSSHRWLVIDN